MIHTQEELYQFLNSIFPTCFYNWQGSRKVPSAPYICYLYDSSDNFGADNKVYHKSDNYLIELYTDKADLTSEITLENKFDENKIFYNKTNKAYIDELKLFQVVYAINI
jgi:hypothetical protein